MFLLRVSLGCLLIFIGLGYLLDPKTILKFNAFMRDTFFRDSNVLLSGKRIGVLLLLIGFILLVLSLTTRVP